MDNEFAAKAVKRWHYLLRGNMCVSLLANEEGEVEGLFVSTPAGNKECFSMKEVDEFIDACMAEEFFSPTEH